MTISVLAAQFPVSLSISKNLETMLELLDQSQPKDLVVFPEGSVSGYSVDIGFLEDINQDEMKAALELLRLEAKTREIHLWVGACMKENGRWVNAAIGFTPQGNEHIYRKINLAYHERSFVTPGSELPIFQLDFGEESIAVGVQLCREIRFPEQWGWLARQGAQVILHLNNADGDDKYQPVWRSHLVSRAAETQRFVVSVNNAAPKQLCPTMVVSPDGLVLGEVVSEEAAIVRSDLDLSRVSDWYLDQCRDDVVAVRQPGE